MRPITRATAALLCLQLIGCSVALESRGDAIGDASDEGEDSGRTESSDEPVETSPALDAGAAWPREAGASPSSDADASNRSFEAQLDASRDDASATVVSDASTDASACSTGRQCGSICVDTRSEARHCGACDVSCAAGQVCMAGTCMAAPAGVAARVPVTTCAISDPPPRLVSQTGCYTNAASRAPAPGLIAYDVNASFWADGATKRRFLALPGQTTIGFQAEGAWQMPEGTILVKEFALAMRRGDASSERPIETRFLVRRRDRWSGYTYRWNETQTDAELTGGGKVVVAISEPDGSVTSHTHLVPSENDCRRCHNDTAGGTLGLRTVQMNRAVPYGTASESQIGAFARMGLFGAIAPADLQSLPTMPSPLDTSAAIAARARSYLEGNCAHCHHPGGPTDRSLDLRYRTSFAASNTCNAKPEAGDLGVKDSKIIVPGQPDSSVLWLRISRRDNHQMPPIGTLLVDDEGSRVVREWIASLGGCP